MMAKRTGQQAWRRTQTTMRTARVTRHVRLRVQGAAKTGARASVLAAVAQRDVVPGLGRAVRGEHRVNRVRRQERRDERRRARDEPVERDRHATGGAGEDDADEPGDLEAAHLRQHVEPVARVVVRRRGAELRPAGAAGARPALRHGGRVHAGGQRALGQLGAGGDRRRPPCVGAAGGCTARYLGPRPRPAALALGRPPLGGGGEGVLAQATRR